MTKGIDCAKACNPKFGSHDSATGPIKVFSASCLMSFQPMVPGIQTCISIKESIQEIASKKLRETSSLASAVSSLTMTMTNYSLLERCIVVPDRSLLAAKRAWQNPSLPISEGSAIKILHHVDPSLQGSPGSSPHEIQVGWNGAARDFLHVGILIWTMAIQQKSGEAAVIAYLM